MPNLCRIIQIGLIALFMVNCGDGLTINFGSGGGFTGAVIGYRIDENGQVLKCSNNCEEVSFIRQLESAEIKEIESMIEENKLMEINYNQPYNMYKFIQIEKGQQVKNFTWSDFKTNDTTKRIEELYQLLDKKVKPQ